MQVGTFVEWDSSGGTARGKIKQIVKNGLVSGIPVKITGTKEQPAAKIQIYKKNSKGEYKPTDIFVGHKISTLRVYKALYKDMTTKSFIPPANVAANAKRALEVRAKKPPSARGMTSVGLARAGQLSNRNPVSLSTIKRMIAYFDRHEVDKQGANWDEQSAGWQAWNGWGGDAGRSWARKIFRQNTQERKKAMLNDKKKKALTDLVGTNIAERLLKTIAQTEKSATIQNEAFKDFGSDAESIVKLINNLTNWMQSEDNRLDVAEKGSGMKKPRATKAPTPEEIMAGTAEDEMTMEDEMEDEVEDTGEEMSSDVQDVVDQLDEESSLLTSAEIDALASAVARRMMSNMDELKAKMDSIDMEMKSRGYARSEKETSAIAEQAEALKEYTAVHEEFSDLVVTALEEISQRLEYLGSRFKEFSDEEFAPSNTMRNVSGRTKSAGDAIPGLSEAEQKAYEFLFGN